MYAACPFRGLTPVPCYGRTIKLPKREATRMIDVTTEALLVALLAPPAVFGAAVALESWRSHRAEVRQATAAARDRHPAGRGLGLCPDCEGLVFDAATHGRYCPGRRPS